MSAATRHGRHRRAVLQQLGARAAEAARRLQFRYIDEVISSAARPPHAQSDHGGDLVQGRRAKLQLIADEMTRGAALSPARCI